MLALEGEKIEVKLKFLKVMFDKTDKRHIELYQRLAWKSSKLHYKLCEEEI